MEQARILQEPQEAKEIQKRVDKGGKGCHEGWKKPKRKAEKELKKRERLFIKNNRFQRGLLPKIQEK